MTRPWAVGTLMLVIVTGCTGSDDGDSSDPTGSNSPTAAVECTAASAEAVDRAQISEGKIEPTCVKVRKGGDFTLLNADTKRHSFTTTSNSPVELNVDLRKGSAFPYRFKKPGTYTFEEASSDLTFTVFVS